MQERRKKILIVDDDQSIHIATKYVLRDKYDCSSAFNGDEAKVILQNHPVDLILLDLHMRRQEEGLEFLPCFKEMDPDVDVIIVSGNTETDLASRSMKLGASSYLLKDHSADQLLLTIESVFSKRELIRENQHHVRDRKRLLEKSQIVGQSPAIVQLMKDIEKIRRTNANVIIFAETGAGKELVARHIGVVDGKPFVTVDSATITSTMAESILFGHERGAFTGAQTTSKGLFEEADGGTIYFDEIANMPLEIQAKLLRVIQEKEVKRLGSSKVIPLTFRVICATNKDLEKMCSEGTFKYDLYERLNVINLRIPPLRERPGDVALLVKHFLIKFRAEGSPISMSSDALKLLSQYPWPGNVRELANLIANLCTMVTDQETIEIEDLPARFRDAVFSATPATDACSQSLAAALVIDVPGNSSENSHEEKLIALDPKTLNQVFTDPSVDFYRVMHQIEGRVLSQLYRLYEGNISQMSKNLRISRSHLYSKLHSHGIH